MSIADEARVWLGQQPTKHTNAVVASSLETGAVGSAIHDSPGMKKLAAKWDTVAINPAGIIEDLTQTFYQAHPQMRPQPELTAPARTSRAIVSAIMEHPDVEELRDLTTYDRWSSLSAVQHVGDRVWQVLNELSEDQKEDDSREQASERANERLRELVEGAGEGDAGPSEQDIAEALEEAVQAAQAAQDAQVDPQDAHALTVAAINGAIAKAKESLQEAEASARAWGYSPGQMRDMPFAEREELTRALHNNRMARFADLIGRLRMSANAEQARKIDYGRREPFTVTLGNQLDEVLGSELVMLTHPRLRTNTLRRFGEAQLIQRKWRGEQKAGHGPMVVLLDCSGSMDQVVQAGITREAWAKAVTLALAEIARQQQRAFTCVLFSGVGQQLTVEVPWVEGPQRTTQLMTIGDTFFNGGTSWETPLTTAQHLITGGDADEKSDIVLITDGDCNVSGAFVDSWAQMREGTGVRVFGVNVTSSVSAGLRNICDNTRAVNDLLDTTAVTEIFQTV